MNEITQAESLIKDCDSVAATINERLARKKRRLELELAETNAALGALADNPEIERVLSLVGKAMGRNL